MRVFLAKVLLVFFIPAGPAFLFLFGYGIYSAWEDFGAVAAAVLTALTWPVFFGLALLIDNRQGREF